MEFIIKAAIIIFLGLMLALAGCSVPQSPEHSSIIDRTCYSQECQERRIKNVAKFFEMFAKNPTGVKNWLLEGKYPKCKVAGCSGRILDGACDVCKEKS